MALRQTILASLTRGEMTGYEITKNFDEVLKYFWQASHQQVYKELARLSRDGCVSCEVITQSGKPDKKIYSITRAGIDELRDWIASETAGIQPRDDLIVKLLAGHVVEPDVLRHEFNRLYKETDNHLKECNELKKQCFNKPLKEMSEYEQVLYLALRRGILILQARLKWLKEINLYLGNKK